MYILNHSENGTDSLPRYCVKCGNLLSRSWAKCPKCGKRTPFKKEIRKEKRRTSSKKAAVAIVVLSVLLVAVSAALAAVCVQQRQNVELLHTQINELTERNEWFESRVNTWEQKAEYEENRYYSLKRTYQMVYDRYDWFTKHIAFVVSGDTYYYHSYLCDAFQNCDSYSAYNYSNAVSRGYHAHDACKHDFGAR